MNTRPKNREARPTFPQVGLPEALTAAFQVYSAELGTHTVDETRFKALLGDDLSSSALARLMSSLKTYDLSDRRRNGYALTDRAVQLFTTEDYVEFQARLRDVALFSPLMAELSAAYGDQLDSKKLDADLKGRQIIGKDKATLVAVLRENERLLGHEQSSRTLFETFGAFRMRAVRPSLGAGVAAAQSWLKSQRGRTVMLSTVAVLFAGTLIYFATTRPAPQTADDGAAQGTSSSSAEPRQVTAPVPEVSLPIAARPVVSGSSGSTATVSPTAADLAAIGLAATRAAASAPAPTAPVPTVNVPAVRTPTAAPTGATATTPARAAPTAPVPSASVTTAPSTAASTPTTSAPTVSEQPQGRTATPSATGSAASGSTAAGAPSAGRAAASPTPTGSQAARTRSTASSPAARVPATSSPSATEPRTPSAPVAGSGTANTGTSGAATPVNTSSGATASGSTALGTGTSGTATSETGSAEVGPSGAGTSTVPAAGAQAPTTAASTSPLSPAAVQTGRDQPGYSATLTRGRELAGLFYSQQLTPLWSAFSPAAKSEWESLSAFRAYRAGGLKAFGAEKTVLVENVRQDKGINYYTRTATFALGPSKPWTLIIGLNAQGRVVEFNIVAASVLPQADASLSR
ncbi:hypothetical protein [Deinococcus altitudinis]|uniref:hypothetical protein n=1 Tax=Deinococcus altitudinis TaxID=468914 RepID=UPI0038918EA9